MCSACYGLGRKYPSQVPVWSLAPQLVVLFWEVMETFRRWGLVEGSSLGGCAQDLPIFLSLCASLSLAMRWAACSTMCFHHDVQPHHGLNPLKPWAKINLPSLKLLMSGIFVTVPKNWLILYLLISDSQKCFFPPPWMWLRLYFVRNPN
jgi:hypothetical protein